MQAFHFTREAAKETRKGTRDKKYQISNIYDGMFLEVQLTAKSHVALGPKYASDVCNIQTYKFCMCCYAYVYYYCYYS